MMRKPSAIMSNAGFVHLHVHSAYSLLKGSIKVPKLAELAKADRQPALALTDTDNMFGALEFSDKMAAAGIQPIIGWSLGVDFGDQEERRAPGTVVRAFPRLVLLVANEVGYRNAMRLCSRAFLEPGTNEPPHIALAVLADSAEGLIALTGGPAGVLDQPIA